MQEVDSNLPQEENRQVSVKLTWDLDTEEIEIESGFEDTERNFKDPIEYTTQLIQMSLEKWIREKVGMICPNCSIEMGEDWDWCPKCGYSLVEKEEIENNE